MAKRVYQTIYQLPDGLLTKTVSVLVRMSLNQAHTDKILLKEGTERTKNLAKMQ